MSIELMTPGEVAALFGVNVKTVRMWAQRGWLGKVYRTLGGHRRFDAVVVRRLYDGGKS